MYRKHAPIHTCIALLLVIGITPAGFAKELYRYKNEQGNTVLDDNIPPEYVKNGYEVVNETGAVLRVVPRQLTGEELEAAEALQREQQAAEAEAQRLREWDESLLRRYSSVEDIEQARDRAVNGLRIRVNTLKSNQRSLKQQIENYQSQAAELERRGQKVSTELLTAIRDLQGEIDSNDRAISDRLKEIGAMEEQYNADIDRFSQIQELVELRRQGSAATQ